MSKYARAISVVAIFSACATILAAQAAETNPFVGTWKLNVAKSTFSPGPAPKSQTVTIAPEGKYTINEVLADGTSRNWSFTPSAGGVVAIDGLENSTVSLKRTGNVEELDWSFNGAKTKGRSVLSNNRKTVKYTATGTDKDGHPIHNVSIFERVS